MVKKATLFLFYVGTAYGIYIYADMIVAWFKAGNYIMLTLAAAIGMALFPVIPFPVIGALLGATYGPWIDEI